jgi:hypothetical protein
VYSIEPNIKEEYREYDTMWQRIATDYLNAGVNINVKDEQGNSIAVSNLAKSHFRTYAQANFVRDSTDVVLSHPTQPMEDFYYGYEYVNFAEQEKILWQQLNGSTENTAQLSTKLLNFVPVTALTASVIEYLKPLPFDDHLTHQAHVRTQHRLAFEQADAQAPALTASQAPSRKRKKSCCKLFSWKK